MKRTLAVLLILAGLGAYVYFFEIKAKEQKAAAEKREKKLVSIDQFDMDRITLRNAHGEIVLRKEGDAWRLAGPVSAPADEQPVKQLLTALAGAESKSVIENVESLGAFGLEQPTVTITVADGDREETLRLGKRSPVSQDLYVQRSGEKQAVYQTAASLEGPAGKTAEEFRDKRLFGFAASKVTEVTLVDAGRTLKLKRNGDDWVISEPMPIDADDAIANGIPSDLASLRATAWLDESGSPAALAAHGLKEPQGRVVVTTTDGAVHTLRVGRLYDGDRAVQVEGTPQIVKVADWSVKNMLKNEFELRERRLVTLPKERVAKLVFQSDASTTTYTRSGTGWSLGDSESRPADNDRVNELLNSVVEMRATEWSASTGATQRQHGLTKPVKTIALYDEAGSLLQRLAFGADAESWGVWAQTTDKTVEAKVPNDLVKNLWP
jgi:hypothetical protein